MGLVVDQLNQLVGPGERQDRGMFPVTPWLGSRSTPSSTVCDPPTAGMSSAACDRAPALTELPRHRQRGRGPRFRHWRG
jgi:hypothetical protein